MLSNVTFSNYSKTYKALCISSVVVCTISFISVILTLSYHIQNFHIPFYFLNLSFALGLAFYELHKFSTGYRKSENWTRSVLEPLIYSWIISVLGFILFLLGFWTLEHIFYSGSIIQNSSVISFNKVYLVWYVFSFIGFCGTLISSI